MAGADRRSGGGRGRRHAGAGRHRGGRGPGAVHPSRVATSSPTTTWTRWPRSTATECGGRTATGRPALDLPAAVSAALAAGRRHRGGRRRWPAPPVAAVTSPIGPGRDRGRQALVVWSWTGGTPRDAEHGDGGVSRAGSGRGSTASPTDGLGHLGRSDHDPHRGRHQGVRRRRGRPVALAAGLGDIGENYADELLAKAGAIEAGASGDEVAGSAGPGARRSRWWPSTPVPTWHFLGAVQRNKVARLAPAVTWWQGCPGWRRGWPSPGDDRGPPCWSRWIWPAWPVGVDVPPDRVPESGRVIA